MANVMPPHSSSAASHDRRRVPRSPSHVPVDFYDRKGHAVTGEGWLVNCSTRGALIQSRHGLRPRAPVRLHLQTGSTPTLQLTGRVVWTKRHRPGFLYGIRFRSL